MAQQGSPQSKAPVSVPAVALSCCEYSRRNPPPLLYMRQFDRLTERQYGLLERYRITQADYCKLGRSSMANMLQSNQAYGAMLKSLEPESWQTGLEDCGEFYSYRWKELIRHRLGHDDHDRNSVREYNTRFTLPMQLSQLEGLTPMEYCLKYCVISNKRYTLYQRIFGRMRENRRPRINLKAVTDALNALLGGTLEEEQSQELFSLFEITSESKSLLPEEFSILCALAERFYYRKNLRSLTEETQQMQRGILEAADFHRLPKRLEKIEVLPSLRRFLNRLMEAAEEPCDDALLEGIWKHPDSNTFDPSQSNTGRSGGTSGSGQNAKRRK